MKHKDKIPTLDLSKVQALSSSDEEEEEEPAEQQQQPMNSVSSDSDGDNVVQILWSEEDEDENFRIGTEEAKILDDNIEAHQKEISDNQPWYVSSLVAQEAENKIQVKEVYSNNENLSDKDEDEDWDAI